MKLQLSPIPIVPGVDKDNTTLSTEFFTDAYGIRFYNGRPEKIGGCTSVMFDDSATIRGIARTLYSQVIDSRIWYLIGTNTDLYALLQNELTNITPLETTTTAIPNSLNSVYRSPLPSNPFTTTLNSTSVQVNVVTLQPYRTGDLIKISGVAGPIRGIPAAELNATHIIRSLVGAIATIYVTTPATSSGTGGAGTVVMSTQFIQVTQIDHGYSDGDRVKIQGSASVAGIPDTEINAEHIIRYLDPNIYYFLCETFATSLVLFGGGAGTTVQHQIASGNADAASGGGYGAGYYGVGGWGVSQTGGVTQPRIWSMDAFGDNVIMTPGGGGNIYRWTHTTAEAPEVLSGAPTASNYVFVTANNFVVSLFENVITWSDVGNDTDWTPTDTNQAGEDAIEGADTFVSAAQIRNTIYLLFTSTQTYIFQYQPSFPYWGTQILSVNTGIIGQNACVVVNGIAYWMGVQDFYMYDGGIGRPIPSNGPGGVNYLRRYVFDNLNVSQQAKCFAGYNAFFNEIWFFYPFGSSLEPNAIVRWNIDERHWVPDNVYTRSAWEQPSALSFYPRTIDPDGIMYQQERGYDADGEILPFELKGPYYQAPQDMTEIGGIIPDSIQTGDITLSINTKLYPQSSTVTASDAYTITPTTEQITPFVNGRVWQFMWAQSALSGYWRMGLWQQYVQKGTYQ